MPYWARNSRLKCAGSSKPEANATLAILIGWVGCIRRLKACGYILVVDVECKSRSDRADPCILHRVAVEICRFWQPENPVIIVDRSGASPPRSAHVLPEESLMRLNRGVGCGQNEGAVRAALKFSSTYRFHYLH